MTAEPFRETVRNLLRDRLLDATSALFSEVGWQRVTMAKVADRAGVSRQTVYNEFGTKPQLAEQLVMRELERFLDIVRVNFERETVFVDAVRAALQGAFEEAQRNALLREVLEHGHSGNDALLPFITQSQGLINRATDFLGLLVEIHHSDLPLVGEQRRRALESVVRLVLSHVTQPSRSPAETADEVAWIVGAVVESAALARTTLG